MERSLQPVATALLVTLLTVLATGAGAAEALDRFTDFDLRLTKALEGPTVMALALPLPFHLPAVEVRTILRILHLAGLSAGLGSVIVLDVLLLRAVLRGRFETRNANMLVILARVTGAGLVLLWLSGLCFLALYWVERPELLDNPKILAKVIIVAVLTLNGFLLHAFCLPRFQASLGDEPLLSMPYGPRMLMVAAATVSAVSWYAAFSLGLLHEFNGTVPAETILGLWLATTIFGFALAQAALALLARHRLKARWSPGDPAVAGRR